MIFQGPCKCVDGEWHGTVYWKKEVPFYILEYRVNVQWVTDKITLYCKKI